VARSAVKAAAALLVSPGGYVRDFVFAAEAGVALEFAAAGGGQMISAAGSELPISVADAGAKYAVEVVCGAGSYARSAGQPFCARFN